MSNDLEELSNWRPFLDKSNTSNKFEQFIDLIKSMDDNTSPGVWTKWKNYDHQVVIETPKYFYKIYQSDVVVGSFYAKIRERLGEIYRNEFHINWFVNTVVNNNIIYQFEQREKLQVCNPSLISFDDLMIKWSNTLLMLEDKLSLPLVTKQIKYKIPDVEYIKVIRDCVNKFEDYAITKDGNVVLLDDSDWFLAPVDILNNWLELKLNCFHVLTRDGEMIFAPTDYLEIMRNNEKGMINANTPYNKWTLIKDNFNIKDTNIMPFISQREQMIQDNIKVLRTQTYLPNNMRLFIEKSNTKLLDNKKEG